MKTKGRKLEWKIGSVVIIAFFGLLIWSIGWYFYEGSPREILSVADQFKPKPEWQLEQETVEPPRNSCIDIRCPSVGRSWILPTEMNREQFKEIAHVGQVQLAISTSCFEEDASGHVVKSCDAAGTIDGYSVSLSYSGGGHGDKPTILLSIEENRE